MHFDRFDIVEAYYLFLQHYHEGMNSDKYKRLCRIRRYFRPAPGLSFFRLSDNGREIYRNLERKEFNGKS